MSLSEHITTDIQLKIICTKSIFGSEEETIPDKESLKDLVANGTEEAALGVAP